MEAAAAGMMFLSVVGFVVGILIIVEFLLIGHRVYKIRQEAEKQTRYLAEISASLARSRAA